MSEARLVVFKSETGRDGWKPVEKKDVPDWVTKPTVMGRLVAGEMVMKPNVGVNGSEWYKAERVQ